MRATGGPPWASWCGRARRAAWADRESGGEGKRVGLGGRRIIKKKKKWRTQTARIVKILRTNNTPESDTMQRRSLIELPGKSGRTREAAIGSLLAGGPLCRRVTPH